MLCHRLHYPTRHQEMKIVTQSLGLGLAEHDGGAVPQTAFDLIRDDPVADVDDLVEVMRLVQEVYVSRVFTDHCLELVRRTRENRYVDLGCSPRAGMALVTAARARAFIHGRDHVIPEDLFALAEDVMLHRTRLTYEALAEELTGREVLGQIIESLS